MVNFVSFKAENDSRLSAQRWERQFRMEFEKNDALENEIAAVRTQCTMLQVRFHDMRYDNDITLEILKLISKKES